MELSFPQFSLFPAELRVKIWQHALPQRTVYVRLRMNMDAWNWASESDWWAHYMLSSDYMYPESPPPALFFVNHESRAETRKFYRRLSIDRELLKQYLFTATDHEQYGVSDDVEDTALERTCNAGKTPWFNVDTDVLEWKQSSAGAAITLPSTLISALVFAVLDRRTVVKSLTIKMRDVITEEKWALRLVRSPARRRVLEVGDDVGAVLKEYGACFLGGFKERKTEPGTLHRDMGQSLAATRLALPSALDIRVDTRCAVYKVRSVADAAGPYRGTDRMELVQNWPRMGTNPLRRILVPDDLQGDLMLVLFSLQGHEVLGGSLTGQPNTGLVPFHGFCLPEYGLS
ncbi:uncharacterized protein BCR38DRAFT_482531 [Pseudomassariella vexata]|uniref:2EXR domain-containing protein n=1 Tax=Pseudomassariella vexata TaxID=1141098 RepID=A0A1Y2EBV2_9PEZI|nr:uncharacterized protein BCR38DRAFT_482531 [Pseudomassariella vexata]ORY69059.1 hypothetical protein BCR38DRAFT_482531 [Pseudomassariella vexata]